MEDMGFPRDVELTGSSAVGLFVYRALGGFCSRTGGKELLKASSFLLPFSSLFLDCSALSTLGTTWILGVSRKVAGSKDFG